MVIFVEKIVLINNRLQLKRVLKNQYPAYELVKNITENSLKSLKDYRCVAFLKTLNNEDFGCHPYQ